MEENLQDAALSMTLGKLQIGEDGPSGESTPALGDNASPLLVFSTIVILGLLGLLAGIHLDRQVC